MSLCGFLKSLKILMKTLIKRGQIWWANLDPAKGTESGKIRPVLIVQTDLLNQTGHPSTIICPVTTNVQRQASILRIFLKQWEAGLQQDSDILVDQIRDINNTRFTTQAGSLPTAKILLLEENLKKILDFN